MGIKIKDLKILLNQYDENTLVCVEGYEGGFSDIGHLKEALLELNINQEDYMGPHEETGKGNVKAVLLLRAPNPNSV